MRVPNRLDQKTAIGLSGNQRSPAAPASKPRLAGVHLKAAHFRGGMAREAVSCQHGPDPHLEEFNSVRGLRRGGTSKANQPKQACKYKAETPAEKEFVEQFSNSESPALYQAERIPAAMLQPSGAADVA